MPQQKRTSRIDPITTAVTPPEALHRYDDWHGDGQYVCECPICLPGVNLADVLREQQIDSLDRELLAHEKLLWDLAERTAAVAANYDSGPLTVAAFAVFAARGRIVAALMALDKIEVPS